MNKEEWLEKNKSEQALLLKEWIENLIKLEKENISLSEINKQKHQINNAINWEKDIVNI